MKTSAHVDETGSVTSDDNSPSQDHTHPDDQNTLLNLVLFVLTHAFVFIVPCKQRKDFNKSCYRTCTPLRSRRVIWHQSQCLSCHFTVPLRSPLKTFSHVESHLILFTKFHLLKYFFGLEKKSLSLKRFQTSMRFRCVGEG